MLYKTNNECFSFVRWYGYFHEVIEIEVKLNRTFHLSPHENICTIELMKNIHYLFYITSTNICCHLERLNISLIYCKTQFCFDLAVSGQRLPFNAELYYSMVIYDVTIR